MTATEAEQISMYFSSCVTRAHFINEASLKYSKATIRNALNDYRSNLVRINQLDAVRDRSLWALRTLAERILDQPTYQKIQMIQNKDQSERSESENDWYGRVLIECLEKANDDNLYPGWRR